MVETNADWSIWANHSRRTPDRPNARSKRGSRAVRSRSVSLTSKTIVRAMSPPPKTWSLHGLMRAPTDRSARRRDADRLPNLDQVAIGVPDVGADLAPMILRRRQEHGALSRPVLVHLL